MVALPSCAEPGCDAAAILPEPYEVCLRHGPDAALLTERQRAVALQRTLAVIAETGHYPPVRDVKARRRWLRYPVGESAEDRMLEAARLDQIDELYSVNRDADHQEGRFT